MRSTKNGFTLIELLAVIVVLAVIALITVPILLGIIDKAKKGAAEANALAYIDAVEKYMIMSQLDKTKIKLEPGVYQIDRDNEVSILDSIIPKVYDEDSTIYLNDIIKVKGEKPKKGWVEVSNKKVENYSFIVKDYVVTKGEKIVKGNTIAEQPTGGSEVVEELKGTPIGTYTQTLLDNNTTYGNYTYMGGTYLKGVQENNYVWYNGFLWKIMGKNQDGTIRLITEENVTSISWGASGAGNWNATGYIKDWLNNYFLSNLDSNKASIIQDSTWCINTTTSSTSKRTNCTGGTTVTSKVGLISLDEYNLSGASSTNATYGLINSQYYWTLTPNTVAYAWSMDYKGIVSSNGVSSMRGVRPVINVSTNSIIISGDGSLSNAYILNQTNSSKTGILNEKVSSGEYVILNNKIYRVVSEESDGTKLIYDGYYEETVGTAYTMQFGTDNVFSTSTGIGQKLNGAVLVWLGNSDKIISSNWYQTSGFKSGILYTSILNDISNPINAKVGLIRVGEMLSGQSASILTKNYTTRSGYSNASNYWIINKYTSVSSVWNANSIGDISNNNVTIPFGVRPVIVVNIDTNITSGNGTLQSPYIID